MLFDKERELEEKDWTKHGTLGDTTGDGVEEEDKLLIDAPEDLLDSYEEIQSRIYVLSNKIILKYNLTQH